MLRISVKSMAWVVTKEGEIWWLVVARALGAKTTVLAKPEGEIQGDDRVVEFMDCVCAPRVWRRRAETVRIASETILSKTILTSSRALSVQLLGKNAD